MKLYTSDKGAQLRIDPTDVLYLVGESNYCRLYLVTGEIVLMSYTLKWYEERWPSFIRIHKQTLINPQYALLLHLASHLRGNSYVLMDNYASLPISRRRLPQVQEVLAHLQIRKQSRPSYKRSVIQAS